MIRPYKKYPPIVRIVSAILIAAFFAQDIVWAYPDLTKARHAQNDKLAPQTLFKDRTAVAYFMQSVIQEALDIDPSKITLTAFKHILSKYQDTDWFNKYVDYHETSGEIILVFAPAGVTLRYHVVDGYVRGGLMEQRPSAVSTGNLPEPVPSIAYRRPKINSILETAIAVIAITLLTANYFGASNHATWISFVSICTVFLIGRVVPYLMIAYYAGDGNSYDVIGRIYVKSAKELIEYETRSAILPFLNIINNILVLTGTLKSEAASRNLTERIYYPLVRAIAEFLSRIIPLNAINMDTDHRTRRVFGQIIDLYSSTLIFDRVVPRKKMLANLILAHITPPEGDKRQSSVRNKVAQELLINRIFASSDPHIFEPALEAVIELIAKEIDYHRTYFFERLFPLLENSDKIPHFARALINVLVRAQRGKVHLFDINNPEVFISGCKEIIKDIARSNWMLKKDILTHLFDVADQRGEAELAHNLLEELDFHIVSMNEFVVTAAHNVAAEIISLQKDPSKTVNIVLTAGMTMGGFLDHLSSEAGIDWSRVRVFQLCEFRGHSPDNEYSIANMLNKHLISKTMSLYRDRVFFIDGKRPDPDYVIKLRSLGGADICVLGIGTNGRIGFNEPGIAWHLGEGSLRANELSEKTLATDTHTDTLKDPYGYTFSVEDILKSRKIFLLARGRSKAQAAKKAFTGPVGWNMPASSLQQHHNVSVIVDGEAADDMSADILSRMTKQMQGRAEIISAPEKTAYHVIDRDGFIKQVSQLEAGLLGYEVSEMLNRPVWSFMAPTHYAIAKEAIMKKMAIAQSSITPVVRPYIKKDGSILWVEISDTQILDASGRPLEMLSVLRPTEKPPDQAEGSVPSGATTQDERDRSGGSELNEPSAAQAEKAKPAMTRREALIGLGAGAIPGVIMSGWFGLGVGWAALGAIIGVAIAILAHESGHRADVELEFQRELNTRDDLQGILKASGRLKYDFANAISKKVFKFRYGSSGLGFDFVWDNPALDEHERAFIDAIRYAKRDEVVVDRLREIENIAIRAGPEGSWHTALAAATASILSLIFLPDYISIVPISCMAASLVYAAICDRFVLWRRPVVPLFPNPPKVAPKGPSPASRMGSRTSTVIEQNVLMRDSVVLRRLNEWFYKFKKADAFEDTFDTAASTGSHLTIEEAERFARQLDQMQQYNVLPDEIVVYEIGCGNVRYAGEFLSHLREIRPQYYERLSYAICDFSAKMLDDIKASRYIVPHLDRIHFVQADVTKELPFTKPALMIRCNELLDDLMPMQLILKQDGKFYDMTLEMRIKPDARFVTRDGVIVPQADAVRWIMENNMDELSRLDPSFMSKIEAIVDYREIADIASYPYGEYIAQIYRNVEFAEIPLNIGAIDFVNRAIKCLYPEYGQFIAYDYGVYKDSMETVDTMRRYGGQPTMDVNFLLLEKIIAGSAEGYFTDVRKQPNTNYPNGLNSFLDNRKINFYRLQVLAQAGSVLSGATSQGGRDQGPVSSRSGYPTGKVAGAMAETPQQAAGAATSKSMSFSERRKMAVRFLIETEDSLSQPSDRLLMMLDICGVKIVKNRKVYELADAWPIPDGIEHSTQTEKAQAKKGVGRPKRMTEAEAAHASAKEASIVLCQYALQRLEEIDFSSLANTGIRDLNYVVEAQSAVRDFIARYGSDDDVEIYAVELASFAGEAEELFAEWKRLLPEKGSVSLGATSQGGRDQSAGSELNGPLAVGPAEITRFIKSVEDIFVDEFQKNAILFVNNERQCTIKPKILAKAISGIFGIPIGTTNSYRVQPVPGEYFSSDREKPYYHQWLAVYLGGDEPSLFVDPSYGQFDPEGLNKIIVGPYRETLANHNRLQEGEKPTEGNGFVILDRNIETEIDKLAAILIEAWRKGSVSLGATSQEGRDWSSGSELNVTEDREERLKSADDVLVEIDAMAAKVLAEHKFTDGARIILSESLFAPSDAEQLRSVLRGKFGDSSPIKVAAAKDMQTEVNRRPGKERAGCVLSKDDYDNTSLWNSLSDKATVLVLGEDLQGDRYLHIEGVIGLVRAMMAGDASRGALAGLMGLLFRKVEDMDSAALVELLLTDPRKFADRVKFKPVNPADIEGLNQKYRIAVETYLINA